MECSNAAVGSLGGPYCLGPTECGQALSVPRDDTVLHALRHRSKWRSVQVEGSKQSLGRSWMQRNSQSAAWREKY